MMFVFAILSCFLLERVSAKCESTFPPSDVATITNIRDLHPHRTSTPGISHVTLDGRAHTGVGDYEFWMHTAAHAVSSLVQYHTGPKTIMVLSGAGTLIQLKPDGTVEAHIVTRNSTVSVPAHVVHQLTNTGEHDLNYIVVMGGAKETYIFAGGFDEAVKARAKSNRGGGSSHSHPWDDTCGREPRGPPPRAETLKERRLRERGGSGRTDSTAAAAATAPTPPPAPEPEPASLTSRIFGSRKAKQEDSAEARTKEESDSGGADPAAAVGGSDDQSTTDGASGEGGASGATVNSRDAAAPDVPEEPQTPREAGALAGEL